MSGTADSDIGTLRHERYMALLGTFNRHIEHYCIVHSNSRAEADDLMQDVFVAVWENIDGLRADSTPPQVNRWLYKVMRTVFIRHLRHRPAPGMTTELSDAEGIRAEEHDSTEELVEDLVAQLPVDDQQILRLRFSGYSNIEIAQRLGVRENTLNKRMSRIIQKVKDIYTRLYESRQSE